MTANSEKAESEELDPSKSDPVPIWLVNDDTSQLMIQERVLGRGDFRVRSFVSPLEAIAAARREPSPPFLVTDTNMPGMSGMELARFWCDLHSDARILVLSASSLMPEQEDEFKTLSPTAVHLLSSYRIGDLISQARQWFLQENQQQESEVTKTPLEAASSPRGPDAAPYDEVVWSKLLTLGGATFLSRALQRFATNGNSKLEQMEQAANRSDWSTIHACAHSLKGSAGLVGANMLLQACDRLEMLTAAESGAQALQKQEALSGVQEAWSICLDALPPDVDRT